VATELTPNPPEFLKEKIITEYLKDFNMRRVARVLGRDKSWMFRFLSQPEIIEECQARLAKIEVTQERVREELFKLAFYSPTNFFDDAGNLVPLTELDDNTAMAITGLEVSEIFDGVGKDKIHVGYVKKLKLADKGQNLERLGRYLKMFTDKIEHSGKIDGEKVDEELKSLLQELRQRKNDPAA
jgi:phage terminase small subunit